MLVSFGLEVREMEDNNWIPVSSGIFPDAMHYTQSVCGLMIMEKKIHIGAID